MAEPPPAARFLDTNVVLYAFAVGDDPRASVASALLREGGFISVQVLNEFANVALRKLRFTHDEVEHALAAIRGALPRPLPVSVATHEAAVALVRRHGFAFYDAVLVASALEAGCATLLTEDMPDGLVVSGTLTIRNPFRTARA